MPVRGMDRTRLRLALEQLARALLDHSQWQEGNLRAIVQGGPFDATDPAGSVHPVCGFDRWYFDRTPAALWGYPAFAALGVEHERLHRIADHLLREMAGDAPLGVEAFDDLIAGSARLRRALDTLAQCIEGSSGSRDELTGAAARAEMLPALRAWHELAARGVQQCCIAFMDLDRFKQINDTHGHRVGDEVLSTAVQHLARCLRPYDRVFRYGGDEFLIALPGADLAIGQAVIRRVREGLAGRARVAAPGGVALGVTASFGLALLDPDVSVEDAIERADQALLLAKTAGRNRAISWDPSVTTGARLRRLRRLRPEDVTGKARDETS
jgi:diguanylate cyclase (GGDEF)-like protein